MADEQLAAFLAAGVAYKVAAKRAGVSESTLRRRLRDPEFRQLLDDYKDEMFGRAAARLGRALWPAVHKLERLMTESDDARVQLGAAREIISATLKTRQALDFERRLDELEGLLKDRHDDTDGAAGELGATGPEPPDGERPADAGGDPAGPGEPIPLGGDDAGPLAGESAPLTVEPDDALGLPPGGQ